MSTYADHHRKELNQFIDSRMKQLDQLGKYESSAGGARTSGHMAAIRKAERIQGEIRQALGQKIADNRARGRFTGDGKNF